MFISLKTWCLENNREDILNQWDKEKNNELSVDSVHFGSDKKVGWICIHGHKWDAIICSRTKQNTGCPYCSGRLAIKGVTDLQTKFPELSLEWDYEKNGELRPSDVLPSSNKKVWWICGKGHSYQSDISNRSSLHRGCPYCSGSKLLKGFNDFETWCHQNNRIDLLDEWNSEKNQGIQPSDIIQGGNGQKYWWKGKCGHEWDSVISSRIHERIGKTTIVKTAGCPYCSSPPKRILKGFNDLEFWCKNNNREELLNEWNYEKNTELHPDMITYGSGKKVWWICSKKHEWQAQVSMRTTGSKTNCPICSRGQSSFPEQAVAFYLGKLFDIEQRIKIKGYEVDIFIRELNIAIEYDGKQWHKGIESKQREIKKQKIVEQEGVKLIRIKEHDTLQYVDNNIIFFVAYSGKYITEEFTWMLYSLFDLISKLSNKSIDIATDIQNDEMDIRNYYMNTLKANSVQMLYPELVPEWDTKKNKGVTPDVYSAHNNQKVWWRCSEGHSWQATIVSRSRQKNGCPYCAGQKITTGKNDLETWCKNNNSNLLDEWDYEKNQVVPCEIPRTYSKENVWWKCKNGHTWQATVSNRMHGTGCPYCNKGRATKGGSHAKITLLQWCKENNSNLYLEWNHNKNGMLKPENVSYGSHNKAWWICNNGHEWEAQIKSRIHNHGCPFCSGTNKKAIAGVNDLQLWCEQNDKLYILDEWDYEKNGDLTPNQVTYGSHKRVSWKCSKGHCWEAVIKERTKIRGNTCPICRKGNN